MFVDKTGTVLDDQDFYPWGGTVPGVGVSTSNNHYKFTGKERDSETGLDYFGARYYSNGLGRWITPDWAAIATAVPERVGYSIIMSEEYENVLIQVFGSASSTSRKSGIVADDIVATIHWKKRKCQ